MPHPDAFSFFCAFMVILPWFTVSIIIVVLVLVCVNIYYAKVNPKFHQAGALYDMVQPISDVCNPAGEWNHVVLTVDHNRNEGSVVLNGTEIVTFTVHGPEWDALLLNSKFSKSEDYDYLGDKRWYDFAIYPEGYISLQDHPGKAYFKNIRIKELK